MQEFRGEVLGSVASLTEKMEKIRIESKKQKISLIFSSNFLFVNLSKGIGREKSTI